MTTKPHTSTQPHTSSAPLIDQHESTQQTVSSQEKMDNLQKTLYVLRLCALSAFLGTCGSAFAKYSFMSNQVGDFFFDRCNDYFSLSAAADSTIPITLSTTQKLATSFPLILPTCITFFSTIVRIIQLGLTIGLNTFGLALSLPASHASSSSLTTTLGNAFGFIFNALFGILLFDERITPQYGVGLSFILLGIGLLCIDNIQQTAEMELEKALLQKDKEDQIANHPKNKKKQDSHSLPSQNEVDILAHKNTSLFQQLHDIFVPLEEQPLGALLLGAALGAFTFVLWFYYVVFSNAP